MPSQENKAKTIWIVIIIVLVLPFFTNAEKIVVDQSNQLQIDFYNLDVKSQASNITNQEKKEGKEIANNYEKRFVDFSKMDMPQLSKNERRVYEVCQSLGIKDNAQLANVLAQVNIESSFVPKREYKAGFNQAWLVALQSRYWYSGYMGRGLIQLTWKNNYQKMGEILKVDLINNPDLLISDFDLSAKVACLGMRDGLFTTIKLDDCINSKIINYRCARKTVNGNDKAEKVHNLSQDYYNKIIASKPY